MNWERIVLWSLVVILCIVMITMSLYVWGGVGTTSRNANRTQITDDSLTCANLSVNQGAVQLKSNGEVWAKELHVADTSSLSHQGHADFSYVWHRNYHAVVTVTAESGPGHLISGSGFFINPQGLLVTVAHNVYQVQTTGYQEAQRVHVFVTNWNGTGESRMVPATIVGADIAADVALLQVDGLAQHAFLEWGDSTKHYPGSPAATIGNPIAVDTQSISVGHIRDQTYQTKTLSIESITSTISVFSGNSGGPIVNLEGKVIGMISFTSVMPNAHVIVQGTSLPVRVDSETFSGGPSQHMLQQIVTRIQAKPGLYQEKAWLGVKLLVNDGAFYLSQQGQGLQEANGQAIAEFAHPDSPLAQVMHVHDVITHVNGQRIYDHSDTHQVGVSNLTWFMKKGDKLNISYLDSMDQFRPKQTQVDLLDFTRFPQHDVFMHGYV